eukprot:Nk52_evm7s16 gene=Nk52_evmTU7s16
MSGDLPCYTLIGSRDDADQPTEAEFKKAFESGGVSEKVRYLKKLVVCMLNGEKFPSLLMIIIRYVLPMKEHAIKKVLLLYWEIVPKTTPEGKLMQEMILVCDAYRKDLQHPNEFIRGSTLRFLCKLKEAELLEPLMPAIRSCLEHRHSYVRRNAVLAIYTIYRSFDFLIPDAPELVHNYLMTEQDMSCKRNAFILLTYADQSRALEYLSSCMDSVGNFGDILQLVVVELIHKVCHSSPGERGRFIKCIYALINSNSNSVRYDAAGCLLTMSTHPIAVKAAASTYVDLAVKVSDNNVKLIVLGKLADMSMDSTFERTLQDLAMDILRVLQAPDLEVRKKTLELVMGLICSRNSEEIVLVLKKEITKTQSSEEFEKIGEYRQLLVRALHQIGVQFPNIAVSIVPLLMEFLNDSNAASAGDVILFVREAIERFPNLRREIIDKLLDSFSAIKSSKVFRAGLWIVGEYAESIDDINTIMEEIRRTLGDIPIVDSELKKMAGNEEEEAPEGQRDSLPNLYKGAGGGARVTADGTYATESALSSQVKDADGNGDDQNPTALRSLLLAGDFFLGSVLATTLTKLVLRQSQLCGDQRAANAFSAEAMLIMASVVHLGKSGLAAQAIDEDSHDRVMLCLRALSEPTEFIINIFKTLCRKSFLEMLEAAKTVSEESKLKAMKGVSIQVDDLIQFKQLKARGSAETGESVDEFEVNLSRATGADVKAEEMGSKLSKVHQLTGFSDPVYAEAYVNVHQYDIVLDILVVNQTPDVLQNLSLELATLGDLKLVERPSTYTLAGHDFCQIKANVKVSSTETGIIFGNIVYDVSSTTSDRNCVVLNDIHIDIMDYITPAYCTDVDFRSMWAEFEWENKVSVNTNITGLNAYLQHILKCTNMKCLTPESALEGDCGFLAANLYAKSIFGEDALTNICIEQTAEGKISGHIRIRSKTQGIALSLGDKITLSQKIAK